MSALFYNLFFYFIICILPTLPKKLCLICAVDPNTFRNTCCAFRKEMLFCIWAVLASPTITTPQTPQNIVVDVIKSTNSQTSCCKVIRQMLISGRELFSLLWIKKTVLFHLWILKWYNCFYFHRPSSRRCLDPLVFYRALWITSFESL